MNSLDKDKNVSLRATLKRGFASGMEREGNIFVLIFYVLLIKILLFSELIFAQNDLVKVPNVLYNFKDFHQKKEVFKQMPGPKILLVSPVPELAETLGKVLNKKVFALGASGYTSTQELFLLQFNIDDLKPDYVIVFDGYWDVFYSSSYEWHKGYSKQYEEIEKEENKYMNVSEYRMDTKLKDLFRFTIPFYIQSIKRLLFPTVNEEAVDASIENLKNMYFILKNKNIPSLFIFQPVRNSTQLFQKTSALTIQKLESEFKDKPLTNFISFKDLLPDHVFISEENYTREGYEQIALDLKKKTYP